MQAQAIHPIFFVHVPKTAGTSFCDAARMAFTPAACDFDYGTAAPETSARVRKWVYETGDPFMLLAEMRRAKARMLAGHVPVQQYAALFASTRILSFVRDPLQQLLSHHAHLSERQKDPRDLMTLARSPQGAGVQPYYLGGVPLEAMGVVGVTERQADSIALMNSTHGLSLKARVANVNPNKPREASYEVEPAVRQQLLAMLGAATRLHQRANVLLDLRLKAKALGQAFVNGAITRRLPDRVEGFAFLADQPKAMQVQVLVDGQPRATVRCASYLPQLALLNVPRRGHVGFSLKLDPPVPPEATLQVKVLNPEQELPGP